MSEQGVQEGIKHTQVVVAYIHHLGLSRQEVQDLVTEGGVQSQRED